MFAVTFWVVMVITLWALKWIKSYFSNRLQFVEYNGYVSPRANLVPRSLLRNRTETLATQATTSPNGELSLMLPNKSILPLRRSVFIGLPARATSNREMIRVYIKKKDKMADGAPSVSHPRFNGAAFCGKWTGRFRSSGGQI